MDRRTGNTSKQIREAPQGAVFVWCNHHIWYPRELAKFLKREDLDIQPPNWIKTENIQGRTFRGIVVDHAAQLRPSERNLLAIARIAT